MSGEDVGGVEAREIHDKIFCIKKSIFNFYKKDDKLKT